MKNIILLGFILIGSISSAQVANDNCTTAQAVNIPPSGNTCITGTTIGATSDLTTNICDTGAPGNEVWFVYTVTGTQNTITVTPTGGPSLQQAVVTVDGTGCADAAFTTCNASPTNGGTATATWTFAIGTQVWISVESNNGVQGQFQLCITSITPPPGTASSCATATPICNKNNFSVPVFPANNNAFTPPCFLSTLQQPIFYQFTVGQSGTCIWSADPQGAAEYDWAMYNITSGCPGTLVCCNFNFGNATGAPVGMATGGAGACGTNGFGGAPMELSPPANVVAGQTYLIIIDNYSNNGIGFDFTWGGTFQIAPTAVFTATPATSCGPTNVSFTNTSIAATSYNWNFGNGNTSVAANPGPQNYSTPGTYLVSLVATSATGCQNAASQSVTINPPPVMTSANTATICSGTAVNIPLTADIPSNFTWVATANPNVTGESTSVQATATLNNTLTNTTGVPQTVVYTVTPTSNPGGCVGTAQTVNVTVNPAPIMTSSNAATICSGATVNIPLTASTASTFTWIAAANANVTGESTTLQATSTLNNTLTNTTGVNQTVVYTVTPTSTPAGCPGTPQTVNITVNPTPAMTSANTAVICSGAVVNIPLTANTASTFTWIAAANGNVTGESTTLQATSTLNNTLINTTLSPEIVVYTVTPTSTPAGCLGTPQTVNVTVNPTPIMTSPNSATICSGTAVNIPLTANPASTFSWIATSQPNVTGESTTAQGAATLNNTLTNTTAVQQSVTYTVTPTSTPAGCPGTPQTVTVLVDPTPTVVDPVDQVICANTATAAVNFVGGVAGTTFNWTNNTTSVGLGASGSGNIASFNGINAGSTPVVATVTVTPTAAGCAGPSQNFTITVNPLPTFGLAFTNPTVCGGADGTITINGLNASTNYTITYTGAGVVGPSVMMSNGAGNVVIAGLIAGSYTNFTVAFAGCTTVDNTIITLVDPNSPVVGAGVDQTVCQGTAVTLTANNPNGAAISWNNGVTDGVAFVPAVGTISYTVTANLAGCIATDQVDVTVNPTPTVTDPADQVLCANTNTTAVNFVGAVPGTTFNWTNDTPSIGIAGAGSGNIAAFNAVNAGTTPVVATITVTPTAMGCSGTAQSFTISVNPIPTVADPADQVLCANTNTTAVNFAGTVAGTSFDWSNTSPSIGLAGMGSGNIASFNAVNASGTPVIATITVTPTANSCVGSTQSFTITVNPIPVVGAGIDQVICVGTAVTLTANNPNGAGITWDNGVADGVAFVPAAGTITYTVTANLAGCIATDQVNVTANPSPIISVAYTDPTICGGSDGTITISGLAAATNYNVSYNNGALIGPNAMVSNGAGEIIITGLVAGSYTGFTVELNGCTSSDNSILNLVDPNAPIVGAGVDQTVCQGTAVTLTANNPDGATITWNNGVTDGVAFNPAVGTTNYTVTANLAGCISTDQVTVTVNPTPTINAGSDQSVCEGTQITLIGNGAGVGGNYVWDNGALNNTPFNPPVGTTIYTVTGTSAAGCFNTDQVSVTINPKPAVAFSADNLIGCAPLLVNFTNLSVPVGNNCQWNFGNGTTAVGCGTVTNTYTNPGVYSVGLTVTTVDGCSASVTYNSYITVSEQPLAAFSYSPTAISVDNPSVDFTNHSMYADNYDWDFGAGGTNSQLINPSYNYPNVGDIYYTVTLIASNLAGCVDSAIATIYVQDEIIFYVPNVFTPDDDDINNTFTPVFTSGFDIYDYHLTVFNRWGEIMFESYNATTGWTGTYGNQGLVEDGIYVWQIEFGETMSDKRHTHRGHVTVLK